jgi:hypothetical protein
MKSKIVDIDSRGQSRADTDNNQKLKDNFILNFKPLRKPFINIQNVFFKTKKDLLNKPVTVLPDYIIRTYKIGGLEFGNWVTQTKRIDFCMNTIVALYDLQKIMKFNNNNIGMNETLAIAFGSRGARGAYAHYETENSIISLSRDRRVDKIAVDLFGNQMYPQATKPNEYAQFLEVVRKDYSGYGSLAHEYGHFLDYYYAEWHTDQKHALSGGRELLPNFNNPNSYSLFLDKLRISEIDLKTKHRKGSSMELRVAFANVLLALLYQNKKPSGFNRKVYTYSEMKKNDYWRRLNEIWARAFETYIAYKLMKLGIKNAVLVKENKGKYREELKKDFNRVYPTFGEISKASQAFNALFDIMRTKS